MEDTSFLQPSSCCFEEENNDNKTSIPQYFNLVSFAWAFSDKKKKSNFSFSYKLQFLSSTFSSLIFIIIFYCIRILYYFHLFFILLYCIANSITISLKHFNKINFFPISSYFSENLYIKDRRDSKKISPKDF